MPSPKDVPLNPYAAPMAEIGPGPHGGEPLTEVEEIRRAHLGHEKSIHSVGTMCYLIAVSTLLMAGAAFVAAVTPGPGSRLTADPLIDRLIAGGAGAFALAASLLNLYVGRGLHRLEPWSRRAELGMLALQCPFFLGCSLIGLALIIFIPVLLMSAKAKVVCSPGYREVIGRTPHIRYRTSPLVMVPALILLAVFVLMVMLAILSNLGIL